MTTRTYKYIMSTLSVIGLVAMIVAMTAVSKERQRLIQEAEASGHEVMLVPIAEDTTLTNEPLGCITDFSLTNQSGKETKLSDLKGSIWVADFIFTSCESICPDMTTNMAKVQRAFPDTPNVRFVSISVDPERDTPEVLTAFGERFGADPQRWDFLTGDKEYIKEISYEGFLIGSGDVMTNHSNKFILVDREGDIRGFYTGTDETDVARLTIDIRTLLDDPTV
jgi:protein SCO1